MIRTSFDPDVAKRLLTKVPLFAGFTNDEIDALLDRTQAFRCRKGELIFLENDRNQFMYIIIKGRVKVVETTHEGLERVMAIRQRGDYFGDMGILDGRTDPAMIVAMEASTLLLITKDNFDEMFLDNNRALREIISVLCGRLRECWLFHTIIGTNDAEAKIRVTLARYAAVLGVRDEAGVIISSTFSHQALADRVLVSRETVTRVLKRMKDQNEIEIDETRRIRLLPAFYDRVTECALYRALKAHMGV
jgi:CRP/FNR family transcriptional regulator, cyclic AMP receptor protein